MICPSQLRAPTAAQLAHLRNPFADQEWLCHPRGAGAVCPWSAVLAFRRLRFRSARIGDRALSIDEFADAVLASLLEVLVGPAERSPEIPM